MKTPLPQSDADPEAYHPKDKDKANPKMREVISEGGTFYHWLNSQRPKPHKSELARLQIIFEGVEDALKASQPSETKRKHIQQLIIVEANGYPKKTDWNPFRIFHDLRDASAYAAQHYEKKNFRIVPFLTFTNTAQHNYIIRYNEQIKKQTAILQKIKEAREKANLSKANKVGTGICPVSSKRKSKKA